MILAAPQPWIGAAQLGAVGGPFRAGLELASKAADLKRPSSAQHAFVSL